MEKVLAGIPLVGIGPVLVISAVGVFFLVLGILAWRSHKVWSILSLSLFVGFGLAAGADSVNTHFAYFDNMADLLGIPTYPTTEGATTAGAQLTPQPNGAVATIEIPDTYSHFGSYEAKVWLPPQYFTDSRAHFPVMILAHGNPGQPTDWLTSAGAPTSALAVASAGKPVILVMPVVLQNAISGDSLCVDSASQGTVETYLVKDVVTAVDDQLRTRVDPKQRGIGGLSMGGFCALNLGLKHPEVFSVVLDFSGETESKPDTLPGGNQALYGGSDWQQKADANSPSKYITSLNGKNGPAVWLDTGTSDTDILAEMQAFLVKLKAQGFTAELHTRPGAHDYTVWSGAVKDALPWAAARFYSP